jgi:hypothetical protein
MPLKMPA